MAEFVRGAGRKNGPLLRMLARELVSKPDFTETVVAAARFHDALSEPSLRLAEIEGSTRH